MEDQGVKLEKRPEETPAIDTAEADRLRVLEEKKARREAAAKLKRKKIRRKRIITSVIALAVVGGIAFGMMQLFKEKKPELTVWSQPVMRGPISSSVTGSGETKALKSATLTLSSGGTVQEVYVQEGQQVKEGDPLYKVDSTEAQKAVEDAQKTVNDYQKQIDALNKSYADLTFTAPFTGKLIDAPDLKVGNTIASGEKLGKLVDDSTMKLSLYFSYAYEQEFSVGKTATISIPTTMTNVTGTVETINKVQRISPEGSKLFEVIFSMKNPGTLTEGMGATASLKAADGSEIFAYEPGTLTYNRSVDLTTKAGGELIKVNLINYGTVQSGTVLVQMKGDNNDDQMASQHLSVRCPGQPEKGPGIPGQVQRRGPHLRYGPVRRLAAGPDGAHRYHGGVHRGYQHYDRGDQSGQHERLLCQSRYELRYCPVRYERRPDHSARYGDLRQSGGQE